MKSLSNDFLYYKKECPSQGPWNNETKCRELCNL